MDLGRRLVSVEGPRREDSVASTCEWGSAYGEHNLVGRVVDKKWEI